MIYFSLRPPPADPAVVRPLPRGRGPAAECAARVFRRAPQPTPEQDGEHHAVAVRPERLGCGGAGLAEASRAVQFLSGC